MTQISSQSIVNLCHGSKVKIYVLSCLVMFDQKFLYHVLLMFVHPFQQNFK